MFGPSHTPMGQGRVSELLENLNNEFETIARDVNMYKLQRDDYERKIQAQVTELSSIKSTLYDLERKHSKLVRQYEDEIIRLQATSERGNSYPIMEMRRGNAEQEKHTLPSLIPQRSESSTFNFPSGGGLAPINSMAAPGGPPGPSSNLGKRPRPDDKFFSRRDDSQQLPSIQSPKMRKPNEDESDSGSMMSAHNTLPTMNGNRSSYTNTNNNYKVPPINMGNSAGGGGASQGSGSSSGNTLNAIPTHSEAYREAESARLRSPPTNNSNHSPVPPPSTTPGASVGPATTTSTSNMTTTTTSAGSSAPTTGSRDGTGSSLLSASGSASGAAIPTASGTTPLTTSNGSATTVTSSTGNGVNIGGRDKVIKQDPQATSSPARAESPSYKMAIDSSAEDAEFRSQPSCVDNLKINLAYELEHTSVVCCVRFSNDGKYLATGCNRKAQIFSVETGERVQTFSDPAWKENDLYLRSVCFSPDGKYLACGAEDKTVKLWDIERQTTSYTFTGHTMDIYSLDYSSDGRFIMSGSGDKKAKIWDVEKRKCAFTLGNDEVGPKDGVTSVSISPDGRLVAAGSLDRIVRLWDAQTGYFLERYEGHSDSVYSVAFSPDGRSLASGSLDKTLKIWDLSESRSRSRCRTFTGHTDFVLSVAFSPDGNWLISGSKDRTVKFWDPRSAVNHAKLEGHKNSVISVAVNPAKGTFATGSGDFRAKVWRYSAL